MDKRTIIILGAVAIVALGGITMAIRNGRQPSPTRTGEEERSEPSVSRTRQEVPVNVEVPEVGEKAPEGVAVPELVAPAAPGAESAKMRIFEIRANGNAFDPNTFIVNQGDTVHIDFIAVDKTYDMTLPDYGMKQTAQKGQKKIFEFQAVNSGKFLYYCDLCGGIGSNTKGYIVVVPRE